MLGVLYNCVKGILLGPNLALIDNKEVPIIPKGYVPWDLEYNSEYFFEVEEHSGYLAIIDLVKIN